MLLFFGMLDAVVLDGDAIVVIMSDSLKLGTLVFVTIGLSSLCISETDSATISVKGCACGLSSVSSVITNLLAASVVVAMVVSIVKVGKLSNLAVIVVVEVVVVEVVEIVVGVIEVVVELVVVVVVVVVVVSPSTSLWNIVVRFLTRLVMTPSLIGNSLKKLWTLVSI